MTVLDPNRYLLEKTLIAQLLLRGDQLEQYSKSLNPSSFLSPAARSVVKAVLSLIGKKMPVDISTVSNELGGKVLSSELVEYISAATANMSMTQLKIDTLQGRLRKLEEMNLVAAASQGDNLESIQDKLNQLNTYGLDKYLSAEDIAQRGEELKQHLKDKPAQMNYPFEMLNKHTRGIYPGQMVVIAGRPSVGKSALAQNIALHSAVNGKKVMFCSAEMDIDSMILRFASQLKGENLFYKPEAIEQIDFKEMLANMDLNLYQFNSMGELSSLLLSGQKADLIILDYLQVISPKTSRYNGMNERIGYVVSDLVEIKNKYNIPIIALSQYNRNASAQQPSLADLYQSGKIEQAADVVISLWRNKEDGDGKIRIDMLKNRNGMIFNNNSKYEHSLKFNGKTFSFSDKNDKEFSEILGIFGAKHE